MERERERVEREAREHDTWTEYRRHVLAELERLCESVVSLAGKLDAYHNANSVRILRLELDIRDLKLRAWLFSSFMGAAGTVAGWIIARWLKQ